MANTFVPIQSVTLTGSQATVTFSSIPQTYTDLVVRMTARYSSTDHQAITVRFNGSSSTIYSFTDIGNAVGTASSGRQSNQNWLFVQFGASGSAATANTFGSTELYVPNYTAATNKPLAVFDVYESNSASIYSPFSQAGLFRSTTAISSISFDTDDGTNWAAGSSFHLYGIKNA